MWLKFTVQFSNLKLVLKFGVNFKVAFSNLKSQVCWSRGQFKHFGWSDSGASIRCYERFTALYGCGTRQKPWLSQNCRRETWWNFKTSDRLEAQFKTMDNLLFFSAKFLLTSYINNIHFFSSGLSNLLSGQVCGDNYLNLYSLQSWY